MSNYPDGMTSRDYDYIYGNVKESEPEDVEEDEDNEDS